MSEEAFIQKVSRLCFQCSPQKLLASVLHLHDKCSTVGPSQVCALFTITTYRAHDMALAIYRVTPHESEPSSREKHGCCSSSSSFLAVTLLRWKGASEAVSWSSPITRIVSAAPQNRQKSFLGRGDNKEESHEQGRKRIVNRIAHQHWFLPFALPPFSPQACTIDEVVPRINRSAQRENFVGAEDADGGHHTPKNDFTVLRRKWCFVTALRVRWIFVNDIYL